MAIPIKAALKVSSKGFTGGLKLASRAVGGLVAVTKIATFAILGLTAAFTGLVLRQSAVIDRIGKVAKTTGIAAETLQRFSFAAELAGVSTDQAQVALRRFSRRLGEAQKGTGELAPELKRLGINVQDSDGKFKSAEEVLLELSDAIANTTGSSARLSIAFKAFDSEGAELVSVLSQGSDAMQALFNEADSLGAVLSGSAIQGVEQFNDEFNKLQTLITGIANTFVAALAPALTQVTKDLVEFLKETASLNGGFENLGEFLKNEFLDIVISIARAIGAILNTIINITNKLSDMLRTIRLIDGPFLTPELQKQKDLMDDLVQLQRNMNSGRGSQMLQTFGPILDKLDQFGGLDLSLLREEFARIQALGDDMGFFDAIIGAFTGNEFSESSEEFAKILSALIDSLEVMNKLETGESMELFDVNSLVEYLEGLKLINLELEETNDTLEETKTLFQKIIEGVQERLGTAVDRLQKTLEDGLVKGVEEFEDALANAVINGKADFSSLAAHLKQVLAKAMIQKFFTGPLLDLVGLSGKAMGGPVSSNTPYIVGEQGPELFIPGATGTIIPNGNLQGSTGMGGGTVNYNINAVDAPSFQALVARDPEFIFSVTEAGRRRIPGRS